MRSSHWYSGNGRDAYIHRAWMRRGNPDSAFDGRPQIAIINTASDLAPCNSHLDEIAQSVKNGIWEAGGVPLNLPMVSLGETLVRPTAMLWRNMVAMATEEMMRGNPIDGVVLLGGCDKTIPALLMGAASVNLPSIVVPGGPMLTGTFKGRALGCGTDVWRMSEDVRAGKMTQEEFIQSESAMIRSKGHCNTMGTASTMGIMAEALGMTLPGVAGTPAPDSRLLQASHQSGRRIIEMIKVDLKPSDVMTRASFENAIVALAAVGGSTNAVVHLLAIAGRLGVPLSLEDFDHIGSHIPLLVNLQPSGKYLMEDFHRAGGLSAVFKQLESRLNPHAKTVTGRSIIESIGAGEIYDSSVISTIDEPLKKEAGIAVLRGNLAPEGAVIKPAAASPSLLKHSGPAVVFDSIEDFHSRIDSPNLEVTADSVLVLRGCGPKGYPGMPEVANMKIPGKLISEGVTDMVRVCDGRMSGTAYGTVILHVSPESAAGGPLAKIKSGDIVELDVAARTINVRLTDEELNDRSASLAASDSYANPDRGWQRMYIDHVNQAHQGADLDFLVGSSGADVARESH
ncbi:MAG: dihydroxy-acid dehydratase [Actinobacteria bacterium]|nr:dihydroxy-acid dehydratase [Actinomycetota bacterium]